MSEQAVLAQPDIANSATAEQDNSQLVEMAAEAGERSFCGEGEGRGLSESGGLEIN